MQPTPPMPAEPCYAPSGRSLVGPRWLLATAAAAVVSLSGGAAGQTGRADAAPTHGQEPPRFVTNGGTVNPPPSSGGAGTSNDLPPGVFRVFGEDDDGFSTGTVRRFGRRMIFSDVDGSTQAFLVGGQTLFLDSLGRLRIFRGDTDRVIVGEFSGIPATNPDFAVRRVQPMFSLEDLPPFDRAQVHLAFGQVNAAIAVLAEHVSSLKAAAADTPAGAPTGAGVGAGVGPAPVAQATRLLGVAQLRRGQLAEGLATLAEAYEMDPALAGRAVPVDQFSDAREIRQLLLRAVRRANRGDSAAAWLGVLALMQAEGRELVAARQIDKAAAAGLAGEVLSAWRSALVPQATAATGAAGQPASDAGSGGASTDDSAGPVERGVRRRSPGRMPGETARANPAPAGREQGGAEPASGPRSDPAAPAEAGPADPADRVVFDGSFI